MHSCGRVGYKSVLAVGTVWKRVTTPVTTSIACVAQISVGRAALITMENKAFATLETRPTSAPVAIGENRADRIAGAELRSFVIPI